MVNMTRSDFLKKVCNYEKSDEWDFLGDLPCVVDFHDEGCPPCRAIKPILDNLTQEYSGRVDFFEVDVRREENLARELGIEHLPTLVLCRPGAAPLVVKGMTPKDRLASVIDNELLNSGLPTTDSGGSDK